MNALDYCALINIILGVLLLANTLGYMISRGGW